MKWFTAENINHWGQTADARSHTPRLVEELIRATSPRIDAIRFLGGPSSQLRGFDGILDAEGAAPYVPAGLSVWEFGAGGGDMVKKATEDLEKRSKDTRGVDAADATFVFVTPRNWDPPKLSREEWAQKIPESKGWKDIRTYDSVVLEGWFDQSPAVASRFAKLLGRRPPGGVWTVDEFWYEFSANFDFAIKEQVLLCERDKLATDLLEQLANGPQAVKIRGDSEDEVAAFAAAAIRQADPDLRAYLQDRTLIIDTEDAALHVQGMEVLSVVALASHEIGERALADAGDEPARWKVIIEHLHAMEPQTLELALAKITELPQKLNDDARVLVWSHLRDQVNRHRRYHTARWAMHPTIVDRLDAITQTFAPSDVRQQIAWLFNEQFPDLDERGRSAIDVADTTRAEALKRLIDDGGIEAVKHLAQTAKLPNLVGRALFVAAPEAGDDLDDFAAWNEANANVRAMAVGYSQLRERRDGMAWIDAVIDLARKSKISLQSLVEHALAWQDSLAMWQSLRTANLEVTKAYWTSTNWPLARTLEESEYASDALLEVGRGVTALAVQHEHLKQLSTARIVGAVRGAVDQIHSNADAAGQLTDHFLQGAFAELRTRGDANENEISSLEWQCLPMLDYGQSSPLFLHQRMANDPEFFFGALQLVYRPKDDESERTREDEARASQAYRMLMHFETVPGASGNGVDHGALSSWINRLRELGASTDYTEVTEAYIGHILAHAPADPGDGAWPHQTVRRVIDELSSAPIENGFRIERYNMRGVVTKAIGEGGDQERALAAQYREWAAKAASSPRTAGLLTSIASQWDDEGKEADESAAQDRLRFSM